jgi:pSer/pThr/pTyr-binding forkhead associated (FHA) protein
VLILIVAGGPDKGRIFELLDDTEVILGREGDKVRLNDHKCSRRHARLVREGEQWYIEDNRSRHGTHRNHKPIDGRTAVNDGDYIQIGSTVLVMANLPEEHLERLALLGPVSGNGTGQSNTADPSSDSSVAALADAASSQDTGSATALKYEGRPLATTPPATTRGPRSRMGLILGTSAAAAAVLIGLNVALFITSSRANQQLSRQLASLEQTPTPGPTATASAADDEKVKALLAEIDQRVEREAEEQRARDRVLGDILAAVSTNRDQDLSPKLDAILTRLDAMPDPTGELTALAEALEKQPDVADRLDALAAAIEARPDYANQLETLAKAVGELPDYSADLEAMAGAIDKLPDPSSQLAALTEQVQAMPKSPGRIELPADLMKQIETLTEQSRANAQALASLDAKLDEGVRTDTRTVMAKIDKTLGQMLDQLQAEPQTPAADDPVMLALAASRKQTDALFDQVLEELKRRPTSEQVVAQLRQELDGAQDKPSKKTEALFKDVLAELKKQPSVEQLAKELREAEAEDGGKNTELLARIMAKVEATEKLAPKLDELTRLVAANQHDDAVEPVLSDMLATLKKVDQRLPDNGPLLEALAELREAMPADNTEKLEAALARLEAAPDEAALKALTEEVRQLATTQRKSLETQALLGEVLAVADARDATEAKLARIEALLADQPQQTREALDTVLAKLDQTLTDQPGDEALASAIEEIRATVRGEVRAELRAERIAQERTRQVMNEPRVARTPAPAQPVAEPLVVPKSDANDGLSETERAYKLAFETGKPVRIGGNKVNSATGRVVEGRTLDPAAARAAGITDWRDWYLMDDFAERMRLQKQAMRYLSESSDEAGIVGLPSADPAVNASIDNREN